MGYKDSSELHRGEKVRNDHYEIIKKISTPKFPRGNKFVNKQETKTFDHLTTSCKGKGSLYVLGELIMGLVLCLFN
jgi:hypothetical protein